MVIPDMPLASLRAIPSVEKLMQALGASDLPRRTTAALVRRELGALRAELRDGRAAPEFGEVVTHVRQALERLRATRLRPVVNATGIPLHTNLGRAPLAPQAVAAMAAVAANYNNLEFDLASGERGGRAAYLEANLALLAGAEAATVVNNCAAALVLMLRYFTRGWRKEVVVSRGELVQIGGGFRVPDIMESSGARLREVGTTNRTTAEDFERAIGPDTALLLRVHRANFYMDGFVGAPSVGALAMLARKRRVPLAEDLGSGALVATERIPANGAALGHERNPVEAIHEGADVVCFSGDKLLGGPQAGIIAGREKWVAGFKREPFFRALRADKLALSALEATVDLYLEGREVEIPTLAMLRIGVEELWARAERLTGQLGGLAVTARVRVVTASVGGGTMPRAQVPSVSVELRPVGGMSLAEVAARLRQNVPPVVGYLSGGSYRLDLRTVFPAQDEMIIQAVHRLFSIAPLS